MSKERLSKLQKWILINWNNPKYPINEHMNGGKNLEEYHNTFWIYQHFYKIKSGKATFTKYGKDEYGVYQIANKYAVIVYRSLNNMEKKGLIEIPYRGMRSRGHLIFKLTDNGKNILNVNQYPKFGGLVNNKKGTGSNKSVLNVNQGGKFTTLINNKRGDKK